VAQDQGGCGLAFPRKRPAQLRAESPARGVAVLRCAEADQNEDRNILSVRLGEGEARERFASVRAARLGTADAQGRPHVVVVTFAVEGDMIYTAVDQKPKSGTNLKRLRNVAANPRVTVLADHYSDDWDALWWVRADGRAEILTDQRQMAAPLTLLADRYWQYRQAPPAGPVMAITVERWSGWAASP